MSDLRKRFEKETGKKVDITVRFDCEDSECDYVMNIDMINNEYTKWLEELANGEIEQHQKALHLRGVVFSETECKHKDSCGHDLCNLTECDEFEEKLSEAEVCKCLQCYPMITADGYVAKKCIDCGIEHLHT